MFPFFSLIGFSCFLVPRCFCMYVFSLPFVSWCSSSCYLVFWTISFTVVSFWIYRPFTDRNKKSFLFHFLPSFWSDAFGMFYLLKYENFIWSVKKSQSFIAFNTVCQYATKICSNIVRNMKRVVLATSERISNKASDFTKGDETTQWKKYEEVTAVAGKAVVWVCVYLMLIEQSNYFRLVCNYSKQIKQKRIKFCMTLRLSVSIKLLTLIGETKTFDSVKSNFKPSYTPCTEAWGMTALFSWKLIGQQVVTNDPTWFLTAAQVAMAIYCSNKR